MTLGHQSICYSWAQLVIFTYNLAVGLCIWTHCSCRRIKTILSCNNPHCICRQIMSSPYSCLLFAWGRLNRSSGECSLISKAFHIALCLLEGFFLFLKELLVGLLINIKTERGRQRILPRSWHFAFWRSKHFTGCTAKTSVCWAAWKLQGHVNVVGCWTWGVSLWYSWKYAGIWVVVLHHHERVA